MIGAVIVLDSDDRLVTMLESEDIERPAGVAVYKDKIFVPDVKGNQVVVFEKGTWKQLYTFGSKGKKPGEFILPANITVDEKGNIYVSENGGYRVQKLTADGTPLQTYGQGLGDRPGEFGRPRGVAVDREERVYIVDAMNNVVQIFNKENRLLLFFGTAGTSPGDTLIPAQVIIDYDNVSLFEKYVAPGYEVEYLIIVTSQVGPRLVNVYGFLKREETGIGDPNKESN
jgi:DNA-binding beta-propeller fold protein YncE